MAVKQGIRPHHRLAKILIIGAGMAGLAAGSLAATAGHQVVLLEQNWQTGGCSTGYWRKGFVFESGATTLTGLDPGQPLHWLCQQTGIGLPAIPLPLPMQVHLGDGTLINRYAALQPFIEECERVFGPTGQRAFWTQAYAVARQVWATSLQQRRFPPQRFSDWVAMAASARLPQLKLLPKALSSTHDLLAHFGLHKNAAFMQFIDQQLLITAQNSAKEVNVLFGCTALCYTLFSNHYLPGGMHSLAQAFEQHIKYHGGQVLTRQRVKAVTQTGKGPYIVATDKESFEAPIVVFAIPLNNVAAIAPDLAAPWQRKILPPEKLWSAWQMGLALKTDRRPECLHHQVHVSTPIPNLGSRSFFLSFSHPDDASRTDAPGHLVASISTHLPLPAQPLTAPPEATEQAVIDLLASRGLINPAEVVYRHSSGAAGWLKWTGRAHGHVGGYPQYTAIKPWQMMGHRLDNRAAYICGDSTYPGQGIPGAALSGIIAWEKMRADHRL